MNIFYANPSVFVRVCTPAIRGAKKDEQLRQFLFGLRDSKFHAMTVKIEGVVRPPFGRFESKLKKKSSVLGHHF